MSTLVTIQSTDLITNSRADINNNFSALNTDKIETSVLDTDTALTANSDSKIATQKAVKAYVDGVGTATATTTVKGTVEIATQAQVTAGTATGETGASIVVTPETLMGITTPVVRTYLNAASPATWTKPTGLKYAIVEVQAAGGNGSDVTSTDRDGGGGGGGGYGKKLIAVASLGTNETITIGAVGATSSFGSHIVATNGTSAAANSTTGGSGGGCTGGDINVTGGDGGDGAGTGDYSGSGGDSVLGTLTSGVTGGSNGKAGKVYGSGGSGGNAAGTADQTGGAGAAAIVIVTEYYV